MGSGESSNKAGGEGVNQRASEKRKEGEQC